MIGTEGQGTTSVRYLSIRRDSTACSERTGASAEHATARTEGAVVPSTTARPRGAEGRDRRDRAVGVSAVAVDERAARANGTQPVRGASPHHGAGIAGHAGTPGGHPARDRPKEGVAAGDYPRCWRQPAQYSTVKAASRLGATSRTSIAHDPQLRHSPSVSRWYAPRLTAA